MATTKFYGTGRRKKSIARVRIVPGTGAITINGRDIDNYFGLETLKLIVNQPFAVTGTEGKFDIIANVIGGGISGQAGAIRHGLSRALVAADAAALSGAAVEGETAFRQQLPQRGKILVDAAFAHAETFGKRAAR